MQVLFLEPQTDANVSTISIGPHLVLTGLLLTLTGYEFLQLFLTFVLNLFFNSVLELFLNF